VILVDVNLLLYAKVGLVLCSADDDFARFRDLRWENPLND